MAVHISLLEEIPFFRNLNREELKEISGISKEVKFGRNVILFNNGDKAKSLYVIVEGKVIMKKNFEKESHEIANMGKGSLFGETAFLSDEIHSFGAKTVTRAKILEIPTGSFKKLLDEDSRGAYKLVYKMSQILSFRLARLGEQFVKFYESQENALTEEPGFMEYIKAFLS